MKKIYKPTKEDLKRRKMSVGEMLKAAGKTSVLEGRPFNLDAHKNKNWSKGF